MDGLVRGWKLEISRKSKCVGAKERALTVLGVCRAETLCQDFETTHLPRVRTETATLRLDQKGDTGG